MAGKIVVFGSFVADLTGRCDRFPQAGETVMGSSFRCGPGGKGSNQAVAAHRAGADVTLVTKLGKDSFGQMAEAFYREEGMDTSWLLSDGEHATGAALIMVSEVTGQNEILVIPGACSHITREDIQSREALIAGADLLLLQMEINRDALEEIIRLAHVHGVRTVLNPAPAQPMDDALLAMIDTVTPNETEACALTGVQVEDRASASAAAGVFLRKGVRHVVITLGSHGVYVTDGRREELYPRLEVEAVDTTGAGDAFNGGFARALADGLDVFAAARWGNCTGALSVTQRGTAPAMPHREDIERLYRSAYGDT